MAIIKDNGVYRHLWTKGQLNALYKALEDFEADLTRSEHEELKDAFVQIKTAIHAQM